jgi:hypothetical protein
VVALDDHRAGGRVELFVVEVASAGDAVDVRVIVVVIMIVVIIMIVRVILAGVASRILSLLSLPLFLGELWCTLHGNGRALCAPVTRATIPLGAWRFMGAR